MSRKHYPKAIPGEFRYVDYDEETALWCVFGLDSGHAYSSHASQEGAKESLDKSIERAEDEIRITTDKIS